MLFENATPNLWEEVVFAVPPAHQPDVFQLYLVEVTTKQETNVASYALEDIMLHVSLPVPVAPGDPVQVSLSYSMQIPPVSSYDWPPVGNFGAGEHLLQIGDWHPTLVPYHSENGWQTWTYHPVGDPTAYPLASYDVTIVAPPDVVLAAPGETPSQQNRHYHIERARAFAFLASPEYQFLERQVDKVQVRSYFLPEYAAAGQAILDVAAQALSLYQEYYGPYPYSSLTIAQNSYYGAMEYSGLISMSSSAYENYSENPASLMVALLVHEIAHQWWYGVVGNDQVHAPWLDESLAKYSELLFYERYYPYLTDWWWENHIYKWTPSDPLDNTIYDYTDTPTYIHQIYSQGSRFMADLRALLGDAAFFAFVKDYRNRMEGTLATREDFAALAQEHTDIDLRPLFEQYFETSSNNLP